MVSVWSRHLGGIIGLGTDAVLGDGEDAVAAVLAAAHDKIGDDSALAVCAPAKNNAPAGIGIFLQLLCDIA